MEHQLQKYTLWNMLCLSFCNVFHVFLQKWDIEVSSE